MGFHLHSPQKVSGIAVSAVQIVRAASTLALSAAKEPGHPWARLNAFLVRTTVQTARRFHGVIDARCVMLEPMIGGIVLARRTQPRNLDWR
jgi:phosphatidylserine decarboxylase